MSIDDYQAAKAAAVTKQILQSARDAIHYRRNLYRKRVWAERWKAHYGQYPWSMRWMDAKVGGL